MNVALRIAASGYCSSPEVDQEWTPSVVDGKFALLTCPALVDELLSTLQKPRVAELVKPHHAGRLVNQLKKLAEDIDPLPRVERSPDATGDFLLALSEGGQAGYLVTGDKSGLLALHRHKATQIVSARQFAALFA